MYVSVREDDCAIYYARHTRKYISIYIYIYINKNKFCVINIYKSYSMFLCFVN